MKTAMFPHFRHRPQSRQKGVAAVEMAIVLPLLVLVFTGMIEYGRLMWHYDVLAKATRDAARFLSMEQSIAGAEGKAKDMVANAATAAGVRDDDKPDDPFQPSDVKVVCTPDCANPETVTVSIEYKFIIGGWVPVFGNADIEKMLTPHTTMPYMQQ